MADTLPLAGRNTVDSKHDSTYNMLKSFSPGRNLRDLPSAADAAMICTDAVLQQARKKSEMQTEITDNLIAKVGSMCNDVKNVQEQTKDTEIPPVNTNFLNDVNKIIDRTNNDSSNQWNVKETIERLVTDNNASMDQIISAHNKGDVTSDQLIQKMRDQLKKATDATINSPDSTDKQLAQLARERTQSESIVTHLQKEVHGMMSRFLIKAPEAGSTLQTSNQNSNANLANKEETSGPTTAPTESGGRGFGSSR